MKKIEINKIFLFILLNMLMGAVFIIIANLLMHSTFRVKYIDLEESYDAGSVFVDETDFDESEIYNNIYTRQIKDIINYVSVKHIFEKSDGQRKESVNVIDFMHKTVDGSYSGNAAIFSIDDLIKWYREGFTYTQIQYSEEDFLRQFDNNDSLEDVLLYSKDYISVIKDEAGNSFVCVNMLNMEYGLKTGDKDLISIANDWISLLELQNSIVYSATKYSEYYEIYKQGQALYEQQNTSIKYLIRVDNNGKRITYSNFDFYQINNNTVSDEELVEIVSDCHDYLIYYPDSLEYSTFSNVEESELYTSVRLASFEYGAPIRIWAYIDENYDIPGDAFSVAYDYLSIRKTELTSGLISLTCLACAYLALLIYLSITSKISLFTDKVFIELYALLFTVLIFVSRYYYLGIKANSIDGMINGSAGNRLLYSIEDGSFRYYLVFAILGFATSLFFTELVLSTIRRIKNGIFNKYSFLFKLNSWIGYLETKIENSNNLFVRSLLPYHIFIITNLGLVILAICLYIKHLNAGFVLSCIALVILDASSSVRRYKKASDTKEILDGIKKLGEGELGYKISTDNLLKSSEQIADAINSISDDIEAAVKNSMRDEKIKSDLITNVSHDLKTPLTSIINYVGLLKAEEIINEPAASYIQVLEDKSIRLKQLLEDLIEASKLSSGNIEVNKQQIVLDELLKQVVAEYIDKLDEKKLTVIYDIKEKVKISADGRLLFRVFDNLFGNILKYALEGTRVYVSVSVDNGKAIMSVKNVSAIVNNLQGNELTEQFIRGDSSRSTDGSGLGLYIAKTLIQLQGGNFEVVADGDLFKVNMIFDILD